MKVLEDKYPYVAKVLSQGKNVQPVENYACPTIEALNLVVRREAVKPTTYFIETFLRLAIYDCQEK